MDRWADSLIEEYRRGKSDLNKKLKLLEQDAVVNEVDIRLVTDMIADMEYAIEWLRSGRQPNVYQGIDKKAVYQKMMFETMDFIPDIAEQLDINDHQLRLTPYQRIKITNVLAVLSTRERQCYLLHTTQQMSVEEVAKEAGIKKGTAQKYIERARIKVKKIVS
ncbi:sigma factor-like helix-turn-helix DNA-binding protein [Planomicrobium sp. YIM 101495]|uniref:sigma factor-like helix-turn-helix DNA-binding protein n=1 Tax=Planomicrobium sp. YIM 101495 TaxID=2665160 RepID=UPI0012B8F47C|nr:sigma factor-like helix-turn-helix DNA-binding protein [Planomicrobium sp. YIM 101495]MTD30171.1 RNA polymerase subunit sigma-70 [Planomicrobium sp. YIM 101495]